MTDTVAEKGALISYLTFDEAFSAAKEEIDRTLSASPYIVRRFTKHLAGSKGKLIRATSLLTCAMDAENRIKPEAVKLATAIEILHLATLVHDDVIDDADVRRGISTLNKLYDNRIAVVCGDYLLCASLKLVSSVSNKRDYLDLDIPDYMARVCTGELNEQLNNGNFGLSVYQYFKIIEGKTAALFEASFYAGAHMSGCDAGELSLYKKMGRHLGMIFQLIDDCMDFEATENIALKPVQSDFGKNVITLPIIHSFQKIIGLKNRAEKKEVTQQELNDAVKESDGLSYTRSIAKKYYDKYIVVLNRISVSDEKKGGLKAILDKAYRVF
ncbi:MAG TPA: polyprenyl synthetase family protein [Clostridia bacterium]|nr:polyprenyl synthetase family protein [Clostridia bacterium]